MVAVTDEVQHGAAQLIRTGVDQQVHARLVRLVEPLDLAVGLGMMRSAVDVPDREHVQIVLEGSRQGT
jgi:hypothetical protein